MNDLFELAIPLDYQIPVRYIDESSHTAVSRGMAMSLSEVLPEVQTLSRLDKIRLIQFLARELERDEGSLIEPGRSYPVWSPDRAFTAAAALLQTLADEKGQP
jgi:hypothetical protein